MYFLKMFGIRILSVAIAVLGYICLALFAFILIARGLRALPNPEDIPPVISILQLEQNLEKPIVGVLHANLPLIVKGIDLAPYLIAFFFLVIWIVCELVYSQVTDQVRVLSKQRRIAKLSQVKEKEELTTVKDQSSIAIMDGVPLDGTRREQLLELYARTKKTLEEQKKNLSFLAIDVVNSTGMKIGEDPALAERDFRQYKKLVERIIAEHKGLKTAWTPDGVMICFASVQNAVQAAQDLINSLDHFNSNVKTIKTDFKVRCGINAGKVMFDDSVPMEEMTDRNIDIAGHMQKYADANTIYIGAHALEDTVAEFGFRPAQKQVDGCDVLEWRGKTAEPKP